MKKTDENKKSVITLTQYKKILSYMQIDEWYKASDLSKAVDVKSSRLRELLHALVIDGKLIDDGATKGKRYKKV